MLQKFKGIVLHCVKYNDTSNIIEIFTEQQGKMSFLVPIQRGKKSGVKSVLFQPLALVDFVAEVRTRAALHKIKEVKPLYIFSSLPYNPYKSAIGIFLAEFLTRALREEGENEPLFAYLYHSVVWLDNSESGFTNFHLVFLMRLSRFLGLYPNIEHWREGAYFDLMNACFTLRQPTHGAFLMPIEAARIVKLMRMNYETMHLFTMNRLERNRCLEVIQIYYQLHLPDFPELKSLQVLRELFE